MLYPDSARASHIKELLKSLRDLIEDELSRLNRDAVPAQKLKADGAGDKNQVRNFHWLSTIGVPPKKDFEMAQHHGQS